MGRCVYTSPSKKTPTVERTYRRIRLPVRRCKEVGLCHSFDYIQGGFEGLSYRFLQAVVLEECIEMIGALSCTEKRCLWRAEDVTLGACAAKLGFRPITCVCFYARGPCNVFDPHTCAQKLCEHPFSVHNIKLHAWHAPWWRLGNGDTGVHQTSQNTTVAS